MKKLFCITKRISAAILAAALMTASVPSVTAADKLTADDFVHTEGRSIIGTDGKKLELRGMAMGNSVWNGPEKPNLKHHTEQSYKELSEMGFNCVRFYLNYDLFESDKAPYRYKKSGFDWIDKNIAWAKKYNMGIILNMHRPQGGFQSSGIGMELWTDEKNQKRLTSLWKTIAARYSDEPTIWGYGLINEPFAPKLDTNEKTLAQYEKLMSNITTEIRKVSPYQMIFVERLFACKDLSTGTVEWFSLEDAFADIKDENTVYEFHCYDPVNFTHQNADWAGTAGITMSYPSDIVLYADYESWWAGCKSSYAKGSDKGWQFFETSSLTLSPKGNIGYASLNGSHLGVSGEALFDDITVTETDAKGKKTIIFSYDFDENNSGSFSVWSENGTGKMVFTEEGRSGRALKISGSTATFTASSSNKFELKKGCKYIVSGYVKKNSSSGAPKIQLDYAKADNIKTFCKDGLDAVIKPYADFSEKHNVPVYLGEFGVISEGFEKSRNGTGWVSDMIDVCRKYNIGFNYHTYHEGGFGLYRSADTVLPAKKDRNEELAELFRQKLAPKKEENKSSKK